MLHSILEKSTFGAIQDRFVPFWATQKFWKQKVCAYLSDLNKNLIFGKYILRSIKIQPNSNNILLAPYEYSYPRFIDIIKLVRNCL